MKKITLSIAVLMCSLFLQKGVAQTTFLTENFASAALPVGWTNDSSGLPAIDLWLFTNPHARTITGVGFDADFAIFDSDAGSVNDSVNENTSLTTSAINVSAATGSLFLELDEQLRPLTGIDGSTRTIEMSVDSGLTWDTIISDQLAVGYPNPAAHSAFDISTAIGSVNLMVRFTYNGSWDWWWAIDNVEIKSIPTAIASLDKTNELSIVPNPATNQISVSFTNTKSEISTLKLVAMDGKLVYSENLSQTASYYAKTIDVSRFAKGIYNLQLLSKNGVTYKKVVLE